MLTVYELAQAFSSETNRCIFLTGKAGTGKTTFLRQLRESTNKNMAVVAPTGVAAINAGGVTIHSFFQLPIRFIAPTPQSHRQMIADSRIRQQKRNMLYHLELLVIDEVSMVRADIMDAVDAMLRRFKYKPNIPFGGVQVLMIGDLFQLSPVVTAEEQEQMKMYYSGPYFFNSHALQLVKPVYIELDHVFRQQNMQFVELLNEIRQNCLTEKGKALLESRYIPDYVNKDSDFHISLVTHNNIADNINNNKLEQLRGKEEVFVAEIEGNFPENSYPNDKELRLKAGARIMFIRNDEQSEKRFYNGKIGVIERFTDEGILIECANHEKILLQQMTWKNIRYDEDVASGKITENILGTYTQYPLRLAWAITIHKSQGLTFDKVIIDAARAFAAGQVYVALSRCRTLEGIVLTSKIDNVRLDNDRQVLNYVENQPDADAVSKQLPQAKYEYVKLMLDDIFDFEAVSKQTVQLIKQVKEASSFNKPTITFLDDLNNQIKSLDDVGKKFQVQINGLLQAGNNDKLANRLEAAEKYFSPKIELLNNSIANLPCRCTNKADAEDFCKLMQNIYSDLQLKISLMSAVKSDMSAEKILNVKNNFKAQTINTIKLLEKRETKVKTNSQTKKTVKRLNDDLADEFVAFPQILKVLFTQTDKLRLTAKQCIDISQHLPRTREELKSLDTIKYGNGKENTELILAIVNRFIEEKGIERFVDMMWK